MVRQIINNPFDRRATSNNTTDHNAYGFVPLNYDGQIANFVENNAPDLNDSLDELNTTDEMKALRAKYSVQGAIPKNKLKKKAKNKKNKQKNREQNKRERKPKRKQNVSMPDCDADVTNNQKRGSSEQSSDRPVQQYVNDTDYLLTDKSGHHFQIYFKKMSQLVAVNVLNDVHYYRTLHSIRKDPYELFGSDVKDLLDMYTSYVYQQLHVARRCFADIFYSLSDIVDFNFPAVSEYILSRDDTNERDESDVDFHLPQIDGQFEASVYDSTRPVQQINFVAQPFASVQPPAWPGIQPQIFSYDETFSQAQMFNAMYSTHDFTSQFYEGDAGILPTYERRSEQALPVSNLNPLAPPFVPRQPIFGGVTQNVRPTLGDELDRHRATFIKQIDDIWARLEAKKLDIFGEMIYRNQVYNFTGSAEGQEFIARCFTSINIAFEEIERLFSEWIQNLRLLCESFDRGLDDFQNLPDNFFNL